MVQLGDEGDEALRHEITTLPETRTIEWNGRTIETVVSQFVAYGDGRILEVALDYFAQADGRPSGTSARTSTTTRTASLDDHDGTWLAGRDGPPGMIMPAHPRVGDVYRPENIPGLVFEEVTVKERRPDRPRAPGPVPGAILVQERLFDGALEDKFFAPGYGEFEAVVATEDEHVTVAIAPSHRPARPDRPAGAVDAVERRPPHLRQRPHPELAVAVGRRGPGGGRLDRAAHCATCLRCSLCATGRAITDLQVAPGPSGT